MDAGSAASEARPKGEDAPANAYSVTLPSFEGPLDLLLHLCQKHELDILDIPIGFITEKYLEYLAVMTLMDLDLASEYLVMAATLAHIKSKSLLPAPPPGQEDELTEEEQDPRAALIRRLLEYQKYKQAGQDLADRGISGRDVFFRGMPIDEAVQTGIPPLKQIPIFSLVEAFQAVLSKSKVKLSHDIVHERMTLTDRINELVDVLRVRKRVTFEDLFTNLVTRFDLVITFLALLEMTKLRMTRLFQSDFSTPIYVEFSAQVEVDSNADPFPDQIQDHVPQVQQEEEEANGVRDAVATTPDEDDFDQRPTLEIDTKHATEARDEGRVAEDEDDAAEDGRPTLEIDMNAAKANAEAPAEPETPAEDVTPADHETRATEDASTEAEAAPEPSPQSPDVDADLEDDTISSARPPVAPPDEPENAPEAPELDAAPEEKAVEEDESRVPSSQTIPSPPPDDIEEEKKT